jgi:hypothetical protein
MAYGLKSAVIFDGGGRGLPPVCHNSGKPGKMKTFCRRINRYINRLVFLAIANAIARKNKPFSI